MRYFTLAAALAVSLSACSGGVYVPPKGVASTSTAAPTVPTSTPVGSASSPSPSPTSAPGSTASPQATATPQPTPVTTMPPGATPTPAPVPFATPTPLPSSFLLVSNNAADNYLQFRSDASGDTAPVSSSLAFVCGTCNGIAADSSGETVYYVGTDDKTIYNAKNSTTSFTSSAIGAINALAVDGAGNVYVGDGANGAIEMFPASAIVAGQSTTLMPARTINGPDTQLGNISGLAVDQSGSTLYATIYNSNKVLQFSAVGNGDETPLLLMGSNTQLSGTYGVAVDANGNIAVATQSTGLLVFKAPNTTGDVAPAMVDTTMLSDADEGVCYDRSNDHIFVTKADGSAVQFDGGGNYLSILTGSTTQFNHPKNCAIAANDFSASLVEARPGRLDLRKRR